MLMDLLAWWVRQMLDLLGERLTGRDIRRRNALVIECLDDRIALIRRQNGRETAIGHYRQDNADNTPLRSGLRNAGRLGTVILRLPSHMLLEQEIALPLLAERDPARVLGYEMDRITPFTLKEVFWAWSIGRRDRTAGRLHLRLSLVPRRDVQPLLAILARAGVAPAVLEISCDSVDGGPGGVRAIALDQAPTRRQRRTRRLTLTAAAGCALLALIAMVQPFVLQSLALSRIASRIAVLRPQVAEVERLRQRIAAQTAGTDIMVAERGRVGDALTILATVTDLLPDDAYLTSFGLTGRKLTLNGEAGGAARLIAVLAADPTLRNPTFAAPVTRDDRGRDDLFSIRAEVAP